MSLIKIMAEPEDLMQVFPVIAELREDLSLDTFMTQVSRQQAQGYRIAALTNFHEVMCVAGFRIMETLALKQFLYVDDLVTAQRYRSQGCGKLMLSWIKQYAIEHNCGQLHLDSDVTRHEAHRFYLQQRLDISGYHFYIDLAS